MWDFNVFTSYKAYIIKNKQMILCVLAILTMLIIILLKVIKGLIIAFWLLKTAYYFILLNGNWLALQTAYLFVIGLVMFIFFASLYFSVMIIKAFNLTQEVSQNTALPLNYTLTLNIFFKKIYARTVWTFITLFYLF